MMPVPSYRRLALQSARRPYAVRYPWAGWMGDVQYSHRSLYDGLGEPNYSSEPEPTRAENRRRLLSVQTTKRLHLSWKHTHTWNYTDAGGKIDTLDRRDPWWNECFNPHPTYNYGGAGETWGCPSPMSSEAWWARKTNSVNETDDSYQVLGCLRVPEICIMHGPSEIGEEMTWSVAEYLDSRFKVVYGCTRILCYKDVTHSGGNISVQIESPDYILREVGQTESNETPGLAVDPVEVDNRFEPFGWGGSLDYGTLVGTKGHQMLDGGLEPPPRDSTIAATCSGEFETAHLSQLSADMISSGFKYASGHSNNGFLDWQYIPEGRKFDLIIEADFYYYKWRKWNPLSEYASAETVEECEKAFELYQTGFAGAYGTCHVLF